MCSSLTDDLVAAAVILSTPAGAGARSERPEQMSARRLADAVVGSHQPLPIAKPAPCVPRCGENYWDLARVGANHAVKDAGRTERAKPLRCAVPEMWNLLGSSSCEREGLPDICTAIQMDSCMKMRLTVCPL